MNSLIPRLGHEHALEPVYLEFLAALPGTGFRGDISREYAQRLLSATDNSIYQRLPQAVVFPKTEADIVAFTRLAAEDRFQQIRFSPRGGGTGTNGQSLTDGIVVDVSRHMNGIVEINLEAGYVRVQPGVVLDQLNAALRPHGVFFAPHVSTSSRATIGGMINTDACGKGSRIYGKTSQHVLELRTVLVNGEAFTSRRINLDELARVESREDRVGEGYRTVHSVVRDHAEEISERFPKIDRFMTGYNLAHVLGGPQHEGLDPGFDLNAIICGSEGTLAFVAEAKLKLSPLAKHRQLYVLCYASFDDALADARRLVALDPGAIETVDETILSLARNDAIWHDVGPLLESDDNTAKPGQTRTINLVEFEAPRLRDLETQVEALEREVEAGLGEEGRCIGLYRAKNAGETQALWALRKKGVGLLAAKEGHRRPVACVEDTAVDPRHLAPFIRDFRKILDDAGLEYGMFGHVDVGCLHVRPALDMRDELDEKLLREISDKVAALVQSYGGVMWAEHGKGFRSEYSPRFFGETLFAQLCRIKAAFDPHDQMNPGKLAAAQGGASRLVSVDALKRGYFDRQIDRKLAARHPQSIFCNGNGQCFNYDPDSVMCPSSKVTRDRVHSPKGRAGVMREWLRQLSREGTSEARLEQAIYERATAHDVLARFMPGRWKSLRGYDFSHEVYDAMSGCLSCKACATQCPVKVDVPAFKAEFLAAYHRRYRRPLVDYLIAGMEGAFQWFARTPRIANYLAGIAPTRWFMERVIGIVDAPKFSVRSAYGQLRRLKIPVFRNIGAAERALQQLKSQPGGPLVLLLQDAFTTYCDAPTLVACAQLLQKLGFRPCVAPYLENGKGLHVKGFLREFDQLVRKNVPKLRRLAATGVPMVAVEPIIALTHRDEYRHVLGEEPPGYEVQMLQEWLIGQPEFPAQATAQHELEPTGLRLFGHCTERTAVPGSDRMWQQVFARLGLELELVAVGCCGMCGAFGHEAKHLEESRGIYEMGWRRHLCELPGADNESPRNLATGYSCRSQAKRFDAMKLRHPALALVEHLSLRTANDKRASPAQLRPAADLAQQPAAPG